MHNPLVSIIIPVYNAGKYLAQTINSALHQTWSNKEIIIIDDGSTDQSLAIAKQYECIGVKVFTQQNKGASAARNKGLQEATGSYVQYLDADDLISHNKIEDQMLVIENNPGYVCTCATVYFSDDEDHLNKNIHHEWYNQSSNNPSDFLIKLYGDDSIFPGHGGMITIHSWLCPKNILDIAGTWNEELTVDDDGEYFCRVVLASKGVIYSKTAVNYYRKHSDKSSLSSKKNAAAYKSNLLAIDLKYQHLKPKTDAGILARVFARHYWEIGVATYPQYKQLSGQSIKRAKELKFNGKKYHSGKISNFLAKLVGWRVVRRLSYFRYGF
jgi:glycosyltransferase involved in cell wall biosynthesis